MAPQASGRGSNQPRPAPAHKHLKWPTRDASASLKSPRVGVGDLHVWLATVPCKCVRAQATPSLYPKCRSYSGSITSNLIFLHLPTLSLWELNATINQFLTQKSIQGTMQLHVIQYNYQIFGNDIKKLFNDICIKRNAICCLRLLLECIAYQLVILL